MNLKKAPSDWPAPVVGLVLWFLLFTVAALLGLSDSNGSTESRTFVDGVPWTVWRVVAAGAVVTFMLLFLYALRLLKHTGDWGLRASDSRRWTYLAAAAILMGLAMLVQIKSGRNPELPVSRLDLRTRAVLFAGLVTAIPWLTLVWLTHDECRTTNAARGTSQPLSSPTPDTDLTLNQILQLWRLLVSCVGAFAVGVVAAIASSGALRAAFVSVHPVCADSFPPPAVVPQGVICAESFPPSDVLYYGAFFAVLLTLIAAPMGVAWRARAYKLVDRMYPLPPDGKPTDTWVADRARLAKVLHLDVPILRNPLIALSIFTPLLTGTLAAFIPQLGKG